MNPKAFETDQRICQDFSLKNLCRESVQILDEAFDLDPKKLERKVDQAENRVVKLRDCLIERLRADAQSAERVRRREALDRVNQVLSLIAGVEYPATGIHKNYMKDARKVLSGLQRYLPD